MAFCYRTEPSTSKSSIVRCSVEPKLAISVPIKIPKVSSTERIEEYALNCNFFNPGKMSPPDSWKERLAQRIKNYEDAKKE